MGGRGATLAGQHTKSKDNIKIKIGGRLKKDQIAVNWNDPVTFYENDMYDKLKEKGFSTRASTDIVDETTIARQQRQIDRLATEYNSVYRNVTKDNEIMFGTEHVKSVKGKPLPNIWGYCAVAVKEDGKPIQKVVLNLKQLERTANEQVVSVRSGIKEKHFVSIDLDKSREYVITHEMGHALENSLVAQITATNKQDFMDNYDKTLAKIKHDVVDLANKKYNGCDIYLSKYSSQNDAEWFAETFTNLKLSKNPAPIAKALGEYIERYKK